MTSPIVVRLHNGTVMATYTPVCQFTNMLLAARYDGAPFSVNDKPVELSEIEKIEWPERDHE